MAGTTKKAYRNRKKLAYWKNLLSDWQSSGLTVMEYCKSKAIKRGLFYWWVHRLNFTGHLDTLKKRPSEPCLDVRSDVQKPKLVKVNLVENNSPPLPMQVEIHLANGRHLKIPCPNDALGFKRLLSMLEDVSC